MNNKIQMFHAKAKYDYEYANWTEFESILNNRDIHNIDDEDMNSMFSDLTKLILFGCR